MPKPTSGSRSALEAAGAVHPATVSRAKALGRSRTTSQRAARRWQRVGRAIVLHNAPMTREQRWDAALANAGPRAVLTAFSAAEAWGLTGWEREDIHVLVPGGARIHRVDAIPVRVHRVGDWSMVDRHPIRRLHRIAPALIRAAGVFERPRPACGIIAAGVQQRLTTPDALLTALRQAPRVRHRAQLHLAVYDIAQGAEALSEIDFVRLCRRQGIPTPEQQCVRPDATGRRRYLDARWRRGDGRVVVAEVDGALHLAPRRWWDDQLRQNEVAIDDDALVLRFPSVVMRTDPGLVTAQLRRALHLT